MSILSSVKSHAILVLAILCFVIAACFQGGCGGISNKPQDVTIKPGQKRSLECRLSVLSLLLGSPIQDCDWEAVPLADPPPAPPGLPYYAAAVRQADCSLTRFVLDATFNLQSQFTVANYQDFLHQAARLTTVPDQFKTGCKDPRTGSASQAAVALGPFANGNWAFADTTGDGVGVRVLTPSAGIVSVTDYPAYTPASNPSANTFSIATVDLNGDGNEDLILVSSGFTGPSPGLISIYLGNGDGTFRNAANIPVAVPATGLAIDDVNGDGKLDLVVVGQTLFNGGPGLEVLPGNGDGTFGTPIVSGIQNLEALAAVTADFNNDGKKDVALSTGQILLGDGAGNFTLQSQVLPTLATGTIHGNPNFATGIAAGDFNHDGNMDLAVTNAVSFTVDLYFGKGDGTFTYQASYASLYSQQNIQTTDIDGDGNADLFIGTASGGGFAADYNTSGMFLSLLNTGAGKMSGAAAYLPTQPALAFTRLYDVADFNGDAKSDIVTMDADSGNATPVLSVLKGNGDGTFTPGPQTPVTIAGLTNLQGSLTALVAADFDGDGKIDAAFAYTDQSGNNRISVALGNGDGTFKPQTDFSVPGSIVSLVVTDFNGDTKPDLAFIGNSKTDGTTTATGIFAMLNTSTAGSVAFHAPQQVDLQPNLAFLAVHDLGNGKQDLIATSGNIATTSTGNRVFVYVGNGDGTFRTPATFNGGAFPGPVGVADMNNDGKLDLVVAATNSDDVTGTVTVFPGNGDGTFQTGVVTQFSQGLATSIAIGDYAKIGNQAVVLGSCCGQTYTFVAGGKGDGTFAAEGEGSGILPLGVSSNLVKLVDLTGNGFPDLLLVSNQYSIEVFGNLNATAPALNESSTTLTISASSVVQGQPVTFTAQVTPASGSGTPGGSVTFIDGAHNLATVPVDASGQAKLTATNLPVGPHGIAAFYNGDAHFSASSASSSVSVSSTSLIATTTTLTGPSSASTGASITFTATVAPASGSVAPTGTVTFLDGSTSLGTATLNSSKVATFSTSALTAGSHSITAQYGGDTSFAGSTSTALTIAIGGSSANFQLSASPTSLSLMPGQSGTITITATPSAGFNQTITYGCTGLPSESTCTFSTPATQSNDTITSTLTLATTASSSAFPNATWPGNSSPVKLFVWFSLAILLARLSFLVMKGTSGRLRWAGLAAMAIVLAIGAAAGCGGGSSGGGGTTNPGTPAGGPTAITVTGTGGSGATAVKQTITIQLTVQ